MFIGFVRTCNTIQLGYKYLISKIQSVSNIGKCLQVDTTTTVHPSRPQTGGDKPKLFALDDDSNGIRYLKTTGEIMNTLIEEEGKGNITLPTRFGDGVTSPSLVENWASFGIPLVLLLGIRLGEVATEKDAIIPSFKRIVSLTRSEDMALDLNESVIKLRRLCQAVCVATETFLGRGATRDLYSIRPILDRLSTAQQLRDSGPGLRNLVDAIKSRRFAGTIEDLVGVEAAPRRSRSFAHFG